MSVHRIAGVAYLKVDGQAYPMRGKFKYTANRRKREGIVGQDGPHGYKEMPVIPSISGDVSDMPGMRVQDLEKITNATIQLELANGKIVVLSQAWWSDASEVDTEEGSFPVKFEGMECAEVL